VDLGDAALLAGAGFGAGIANAVAGGGSLFTFPALLAAGYPGVAANVTNAVAMLPGYAGVSLAYRPELGGQRGRIRSRALTSAAGAAAGSALLLVSPASAFEAIVPWLILLACALLAVQPRVTAWIARGARSPSPWALHAALFLATVYGGYFGAGLGIILLAILGVFVDDGLQRLNALKAMLSLLVAIVGVVAFAVFGPVAWDAAAIIGTTCMLGGAAGVSVARRLPAAVLRGVVIAYGVVVAIVLLV
jgi:uncharacterized membrane protein YfcA